MGIDDFFIFSGSSHPALAQKIASSLGVSLGRVELTVFPDGERHVQVLENVRGRDVFVVQSIACEPNEFLMELLIMVDALRRASARSIVAVLPYYGYSRQDRKDRPRVPITAKLVAKLLETAGVDRVLTLDLHAEQIQGFFDIPLDNLYAHHPLLHALHKEDLGRPVVVAPDLGSIKMARGVLRALAEQAELASDDCRGMDEDHDLAIVNKRRINADTVEVSTVIGDVIGRNVVLVDDICSTGGTLVRAAQACREAGANSVYVAVTHGLLVEPALQNIAESAISKLYVSDTIPGCDELKHPKVEVVSVAGLLACAIRFILSAESISSLFTAQGAMYHLEPMGTA